jgi:hypothetical protein
MGALAVGDGVGEGEQEEMRRMGEKLEYVCKCGYNTPIPTGMMIHLTFYRGKKHGFEKAILIG